MLRITNKGRRQVGKLQRLATQNLPGDEVLSKMGMDRREHLKGLIMLNDGIWHGVKGLRKACCEDVDKVLVAQRLAYAPEGGAPPAKTDKHLKLSKRASRKAKKPKAPNAPRSDSG